MALSTYLTTDLYHVYLIGTVSSVSISGPANTPPPLTSFNISTATESVSVELHH